MRPRTQATPARARRREASGRRSGRSWLDPDRGYAHSGWMMAGRMCPPRFPRSGHSTIDGHPSREPRANGRAQLGEPAAQPVVAGNDRDLAPAPSRRHAERVARALDDEDGSPHRVELREAALLRSARRMEREREAADARGSRLGGGPAGDARAGRATTDQERQGRELGTAGGRGDREPRCVELTGRSGPAPPRHAIRLLDERDGEAEGDGLVRRSYQAARVHPAARAVAEHERRPRLRYGAHVHPREPRRCLDLDRAHRLIVPDTPARPCADYPKGMMAFLLPPSRIRPSGGP